MSWSRRTSTLGVSRASASRQRACSRPRCPRASSDAIPSSGSGTLATQHNRSLTSGVLGWSAQDSHDSSRTARLLVPASTTCTAARPRCGLAPRNRRFGSLFRQGQWRHNPPLPPDYDFAQPWCHTPCSPRVRPSAVPGDPHFSPGVHLPSAHGKHQRPLAAPPGESGVVGSTGLAIGATMGPPCTGISSA